MEISTNTQTEEVTVFVNGKPKVVEQFTHPIRKEKLYCFISSSPVLNDTYPLHSLFAKTKRYANIFDKDMQIKIEQFLIN